MPCDINKIDSNVTGLRYAEEACYKDLPNMIEEARLPVWLQLEPNSYPDFGSNIQTVARNPINPSRQRRKGRVVGVEATGGLSQDLTIANTFDLLQGFAFASMRQKVSTAPAAVDEAAIVVTGVTAASDQYAAAAGLDAFEIADIVFAENFTNAANNGVKHVTASAAGTVTVAEALVDEAAPPATAKLSVVGFRGVAGDLSIAMNGSLVRLVSAAAVDFTTDYALIPGEWVYIGGDGAGNRFANNGGFARISTITAGYLEFDKVTWAAANEAGGVLTVQVFFGDVIRNELDPDLIIRRSYHLERSLGQDDDGTQYEYVTGAVPNEFTLNVPEADKVTVDMGFIAADSVYRTGLEGPMDGARPELPLVDAFNTTSDFKRIKLAVVSTTDAAPEPLIGFISDLTLSINNGVTPNRAVGVLGAFDTSAGDFEVGGEINAYFSTLAAVQAVRSNADLTLDAILVNGNSGMLFDVPLLSLGNGRATVEKDSPVMLPLESAAAQSSFGHTLLVQAFRYLPSIAAV
jgi:hypothetical protein